MIYLNEKDLKKIGIDWNETINVIEGAVKCLDEKDFSQPIKPYLKYKDVKNRIIAMPAYVGGKFNVAGIKWICSFPRNIDNNIPRAHSVVVLNNADTGEPTAIINTALLSIVRTASVSGLIMKYYNKARSLKKFNLGIIGWGPIGQHHFKMFIDLFGNKIAKVFLYDIRPIIDKKEIDFPDKNKVIVAKNWQEAYQDSDVFVTCTVSKERYIDKKPKDGSLHLNISLRDYKVDSFDYFKNAIIVDDWDEVCRENTDVEIMHKERGLNKKDAGNIKDIVCRNLLNTIEKEKSIMFNPMGMGIFDIAVGQYYYKKALDNGIGRNLK